jgi:CubicO group peptidase (beta-lactamase class C family)
VSELSGPATPKISTVSERHIGYLDALISQHISESRHPGAQIAIMRYGEPVLERSYGLASRDPERAATHRDLWLLFSGTKVLTMAGIWALVEEGRLSFTDTIAQHVPEFALHGKADVTVMDVALHRGGFPTGDVSSACWSDHRRLREEVCDFKIEWPVGSRTHYHVRTAHWTMGVLIEAVTGQDYRDFLRERVIEPLGLGDDIFVGVPASHRDRVTQFFNHSLTDRSLSPSAVENSPEWIAAGAPSSGGYATAFGMAAFYAMLAAQGEWRGKRIFSRRLVEYVTRNFTGEDVDGLFGVSMRRGLGPHVRGMGPSVRSLGTLASPQTIGQGGAGNSVSFGDPASGLSFAFLTNSRVPDPWHSDRLDRIANIVHASIL